MSLKRVYVVALFALFAVAAFGQSWQEPYEDGLKWARAANWQMARDAFLKAAAMRPEQSTPTTLPGPPTEQRQWRNGAAYSPVFLAAYSAYRLALQTTDEAQRNQLFRDAAAEFEGLIAKGHRSSEAFFYLSNIYGRLGEAEKKANLDKQYASWGPTTWRVDTEVIAPEDMALIQAAAPAAKPQTATTGATPVVVAGATGTVVAPGAVPVLSNKFALIIGNNSERIPFAAHDAQRIRDALITNAGYADTNVVVLQNVDATQIRTAATELGSRVPEEGSVVLYYTGDVSMANGMDSVAGVPKTELYQPFVMKAARIFAFYQADRLMADGRTFGQEMPSIGSVAQMQSVMPGQKVERTIREGKETGVFTEAFTQVLADLRSNKIPVLEFGWQVFYKIRRGGTGTTGGGSSQTPTLPVLANLAADARF